MQDQNFHEIQLSGKQVLFGFISAVVLLVVVFLLGVSVGRGVRTETGAELLASGPDTPGDTTVPATPPPAVTPQPGDLTYQEELKGKPPASGQTGAPPPDTTVSAPPPPIAETKPAPETTRPAAAETKPPPPQTKAPPPAADTKPAASAADTKPAAPAGDGWFLQFGAYGTRRAADNWIRELKAKGIRAFVTQHDKFFRVRSGPFATEAEAQREQARVLKLGHKTQVVR